MYYVPFKMIEIANSTFSLSLHIPKIASFIFRGFDRIFLI